MAPFLPFSLFWWETFSSLDISSSPFRHFPFPLSAVARIKSIYASFFCGSSSRSRRRTLPLLLYILYVILCANILSVCIGFEEREREIFPAFFITFGLSRRFSLFWGTFCLAGFLLCKVKLFCGGIKVQPKIFRITFFRFCFKFPLEPATPF